MIKEESNQNPAKLYVINGFQLDLLRDNRLFQIKIENV